MRRIGPFSIEGALLITCAVMLLGVGVRCSRPANDVRLASLSENVQNESLAGIEARRSTDSALRIVDSVTRLMTNRIAAHRRVEAQLSARLAANDSLLSTFTLNGEDSSGAYRLTDSLYRRETELLVALQQTTEMARLFRDNTETLINSVDVIVSAHVIERAAWLAEREQNTILSAAQDNLISALRAANQCSVLRIPCPTRKQAAVGGFLVGVLTLAVVAR